MNNEMQFPKFSGELRLIANIACATGCIAGVWMMLTGLMAFKFGLLQGVFAILPGWFVILGSIAGLALCHGFLAMVRAQIESRNAIVNLQQSLLRKI